MPSGPLHSAAYVGRVEDVRSLINVGSDVNEKGSGDYTPLHRAAQYGHENICRLMVEHGARVDTVEKLGRQNPFALRGKRRVSGSVPGSR